MAKLIAKTYGKAIFDLAVENNTIESLDKEVKLVIDLFNDNVEISTLFNHPKVIKEEKYSLLEELFKGKISDDFLGLMMVVVKKDRQN